MPAPDVWQFSDLLVSHVKEFMEPSTPQLVRELFGQLWFHMNGVFPRKLWTMTINHVNRVVNGHVTVRTMKKITHDDLIIDPLQILRYATFFSFVYFCLTYLNPFCLACTLGLLPCLYLLPLQKAKWVQLNAKTLQVLKNSLVVTMNFWTIVTQPIRTKINWILIWICLLSINPSEPS